MRITILVSACALLLGACAGKLDKPERFAAEVKKFGGGAAGRDAGKVVANTSDEDGGSPPVLDAGRDAGTSAAPPACVTALIKASCGSIGCHAKGSPQVDLASTGLASRLVDKTSSGPRCSGKVFISTKGGSNLLLDKLNDPPPCGDKMPLGGSIADKDRSCLVSWVRSLGGSVADGGL